MLDAGFFKALEEKLAPHLDTGVSLNGEAEQLKKILADLGSNPHEFRRSVPSDTKRCVRRAVQSALQLPRTPDDFTAFGHIINFRGAIDRTSRDTIACGRLHRFAKCIRSELEKAAR